MKDYRRLCLLEREAISLLYHSGEGIREIGSSSCNPFT